VENRLLIPRANELGNMTIDPEGIRLLPAQTIRTHQILPVDHTNSTITVVMAAPINHQILSDIKMVTGLEALPVIGDANEIDQAIKRHLPYTFDTAIENLVNEIKKEEILINKNDQKRIPANDAPIIKLVEYLLNQSVESKCSDIHIEPMVDEVRIRFRQDGELYTAFNLPQKLLSNLISRIKIMAGLDITEKRIPQDGRFHFNSFLRGVDFRVSTMPTYDGEKVSIRVLDKDAALLPIDQLGITESNRNKLHSLYSSHQGMVVITGPTGSGKTSLLYSILRILNSANKNLITLEDPIEYHLPGVNQTQVNAKVGLSFANGLGYILRQDPDVIMVGEIRDRDTARISVQAALTGHLLLTTLHTNSAVGTITRLADMGIEKYLLAAALAGIVSQKLVRRLCPFCRREIMLEPAYANTLGIGEDIDQTFFQAVGCNMCRGTGFLGRIAIQEIVALGPRLKAAIYHGASEDEMQKEAILEGMVTMKDDGLLKASHGLTSLDEIMAAVIREGFNEHI